MGFFSSVFGGGGSSTASQTSTTTVKVTPITNVDFDLEGVESALNSSNIISANSNTIISKQNSINNALVNAGLQLEAEKAGLDLKLKDAELLNDEKKHEQLVLLIVLVSGYYLIKKMKKGAK